MTLAELAKAREETASGTPAAKITLFPGATATVPDRDVSLSMFIHLVQGDEYADRIKEIRAAGARGNGDRLAYLKRQLPAVTLSCTMTSRAKEAAVRSRTHSGWLQADFDGKDNMGLVQEEMRSVLAADPHVGAVFVGPSGVGIKAVVRIDPGRHLDSFRSAEVYFLEKYGIQIDKACKDIERLCFVSHDPEAWGRDGETVPLPITVKPEPPRTRPERETTAPVVAEHWAMADVREVLGYIPKRPDYETWLRIASGVWSVLPREEGAAVLNEWSPEEKENEYFDKYPHRLTHITIGTVIHYAQAGGFDAAAASRRRRWMGRIYMGDKVVGAPHAPLLEQGKEPEKYEMAREVWSRYEDQQVGDADLFLGRRGQDYAFDPLAKGWRVWNSETGLWERDFTHSTFLDISETCVAAYSGLMEMIKDEIKAQPSRTKNDSRQAEVDGLLKRCNALHMATYIGQVASLAAKVPSASRPATAYDSHRHLLAVQNGVLDFKTKMFRPIERGDCLTMASPARFDGEAQCPAFDAFLHRAFDGDADLIDYWWRIVGYSLTGYVDHDALFFCHGVGANGKSTAFLVLRMLLGDGLSAVVNVQTLLGGNSNDSSADYRKAMLEGKRLILTDELPDSKKLNEAMVKTLLGGEDIQARRPYELAYNFSPTHKIWMVGNHKPKISGTDHGIWRRIHLIPWVVTIPPGERKPRHELLATFRSELSGILNKALLGYQDYLERGNIDPPKAVLAATEEYRMEEDNLGQYLAERIVPTEGARITVKELFTDYRAWCEGTGEKPTIETANKLGRIMGRPPYLLDVRPGTQNVTTLFNQAWRES